MHRPIASESKYGIATAVSCGFPHTLVAAGRVPLNSTDTEIVDARQGKTGVLHVATGGESSARNCATVACEDSGSRWQPSHDGADKNYAGDALNHFVASPTIT